MAKLLTGTRIYGTGTVDTQLFVSGTNSATSTTTGALQVVGGVGIGGNLYVGGTIFGGIISGTASTATNADNIKTVLQVSSATYYPTFVDANNSTAAYEALYTTSSLVINPGTGKIGIGNPTPNARLHIGAETEVNITNQSLFVQGSKTGYAGFKGLPLGQLFIYDDTASSAGSGGAIGFGANTGASQRTWIASINSERDSATNDATNYGGSLVFYTRPAQATPEERVRITSTGSVGIGTSTPLSKFVVNGGTVNSTTYTSSEARIADGTLHLMKTSAGGVFEALRAINNDTTVGTTVRLLAAATSDPFNNANGGKVFIDAVRTASNMDLIFSLNDASGAAAVERLRILGSGAIAFNGSTNYGVGGQILQSNGNAAPTWISTGSLAAANATTATHLAGGVAGQIPYQTAPGVTSFVSTGTAGNVLVSNGSSAPTYNNTLTLTGTTAATSTTTGALQVVGGVGVGGDLFIQGDIRTNDTLFNLINGNATTVNFAGDATTLTMGASGSGTTNVRNNLTVSGNLTVQGTTTIVDSTVTNIADPIITLGGGTGNSAPTADDNKDRGVAFKYVNNAGTTSTGFFGYDDSTGYLTYVQTATITNEVVSGTKGAMDVNLAGGTAMSIVYQSSQDNTAFLAASTSGYILQTNGTGSPPTWVSASGVSAGSAANADSIRTIAQTASASYYPAFVDSNNASNAYELVYTTSSFSINPATGAVSTGELSATKTGASLNFAFNALNVDFTDSGGSATGIAFGVGGSNNRKGALVYERKGSYGVGDFHFLQNTDAAGTAIPTLAQAVVTIKNNGNVGIGTTSSSYKLAISASVAASATTASSITLHLFNSATDGSSPPNQVGIGFGQSTTRSAIVAGTYGNDYIDFFNNGDITTPKVRMAASGAIAFSGVTNYGSSGQILQSNGNAAPTWVSPGGITGVNADQVRTVAQTASATYYPTFVDSNNASNAYELVYTTSSFSINPQSGSVGIRTTSPRTEFDLSSGRARFNSYLAIGKGPNNNDGLFWNITPSLDGTTYTPGYIGVSGAGSAYLGMPSGGNGGLMLKVYRHGTSSATYAESTMTTSMYWDDSGNVGINETSPGTFGKLAVKISSNTGVGSGGSSAIWLQNAFGTNNNAASIFFGDNAVAAMGAINFVHANYASDYGEITFDTRGSGGYLERLRITQSGGVAFGGAANYGSAGQMLQSNANASPTWVNQSTIASGQVSTVLQTASASYFPTFVDSNNAAAVAESLYTTSSFSINPRSGNVGIGTTSPAAKLDLYNAADAGSAANGIRVQRPASYGQYGYLEYLVSSDVTVLGSLYTGGTASSYGQIYFRQHSNGGAIKDAMVISGSNNVGIGTTNPGYPLTVQTNGTSSSPSPVGSNIALRLQSTQTNYAVSLQFSDNVTNAAFITMQGGGFRFTTANPGAVAAMNISSSGNVSIGTTSTTNKFEVAGTAGQLFSVRDSFTGTIFSVNDVSGIPSIEVVDTGLVKLAEYIGQVGINTGTVVGGSALSVYGIISTIGTSGEIRASSEITAYFSSDQRLKENIKLIENPITIIDQIRGVTFDWTDEHIARRGGEDGYFVRKHDIGVIAQEVQAVLPELVGTREDGYLAVKYEKMVPLLIEAIKEQQKTINSLVNDLDNIKEFIKNFKNEK